MNNIKYFWGKKNYEITWKRYALFWNARCKSLNIVTFLFLLLSILHNCLNMSSVHHYMFEESVFLLLGATWFKPLIVVDQEEVDVVAEDYYYYEDDEEEDLDDVYFGSSSNLRIGNRRWGDNGYVRGGRQEARPIHRPNFQDLGAGPSHRPKRKEPAREMVGQRAKRALKREAADKAAAAKHERHLMRLGHKSG